MRIESMPSIPAGANPFQHDAFHMGTQLGTNCIILHPNHSDKVAPYIIICNRTTGEQVKIILDDEKAKSMDLISSIVNHIKS